MDVCVVLEYLERGSQLELLEVLFVVLDLIKFLNCNNLFKNISLDLSS